MLPRLTSQELASHPYRAPYREDGAAGLVVILRPAGLRCRDPELRLLGDCISGTVEPQRYLDMLGAAGFRDAELVASTSYRTAPTTIGATFRARKPEDRHAK